MAKIGVHLRKLSQIKQGYHFFGPPCMRLCELTVFLDSTMAVSERLATMHSRISRNGFWARARLAYFSASRQCSSTTRLNVIILLSIFSRPY